jgi:hypothetical protein
MIWGTFWLTGSSSNSLNLSEILEINRLTSVVSDNDSQGQTLSVESENCNSLFFRFFFGGVH